LAWALEAPWRKLGLEERDRHYETGGMGKGCRAWKRRTMQCPRKLADRHSILKTGPLRTSI
jgi:hypothetical protein